MNRRGYTNGSVNVVSREIRSKAPISRTNSRPNGADADAVRLSTNQFPKNVFGNVRSLMEPVTADHASETAVFDVACASAATVDAADANAKRRRRRWRLATSSSSSTSSRPTRARAVVDAPAVRRAREASACARAARARRARERRGGAGAHGEVTFREKLHRGRDARESRVSTRDEAMHLGARMRDNARCDVTWRPRPRARR